MIPGDAMDSVNRTHLALGLVAGLLVGATVGTGAAWTVSNGGDEAVDAPVVRLVEFFHTSSYDYRGFVHTVEAGDEQVVLESEDGRLSHRDDLDFDYRRLLVWLTGGGGDVRATLTPEGCDAEDCRVVLKTQGDGDTVNATVYDPAGNWTWRVEAAEPTIGHLSFGLHVDWQFLRYQELEEVSFADDLRSEQAQDR